MDRLWSAWVATNGVSWLAPIPAKTLAKAFAFDLSDVEAAQTLGWLPAYGTPVQADPDALDPEWGSGDCGAV